jgi:hypothetical protein
MEIWHIIATGAYQCYYGLVVPKRCEKSTPIHNMYSRTRLEYPGKSVKRYYISIGAYGLFGLVIVLYYVVVDAGVICGVLCALK